MVITEIIMTQRVSVCNRYNTIIILQTISLSISVTLMLFSWISFQAFVEKVTAKPFTIKGKH